MTARLFIAIAALLGATGVAGGAFAAHALKSQLSEKALSTFETGIRYQMYHALALLLVALLLSRSPDSPWLTATGWSFIIGIAIFSGSLYALSLSGIRWLGAITPLGGAAFILGWILLAIASPSFKP
ncbi:DUF423 domain-containing protein [Romeria aff. gracilis LEGE 07310]|uniref:DUF423 domain-containing protein n=1 Tax=Vasconcelosia minhoensis LEGE 07310 TaxID=915328 RepID=A0A8J7A4L3_9CYAN|nr:DUF423 domain-containing protein [Romeria gracilis]MBE9075730.1 DUF423 domain-containing protein [Romeria aff. gracilis LEGE 07310]